MELAKFQSFFETNYKPLKGIGLGRPIFEDRILNEDCVNIPLNVLTRHGLITGSTGTGKSRVIQLMIEALSEQGVPVFLSDLKGDMSGFSVPGVLEKVAGRSEKLNYKITPKSFKTNYWGSQDGLIKFRLNLQNIDYVILAKLLELNPTQESHLGALFKYAHDNKLELANLKDLNDLIYYLIKYPEKSIGSSKESLSVISRKINNLEFSNFDKFFGQPAIDINHLLNGNINILWLQNYQQEKFNVGNIVSCLLSKLYYDLPEVGNVDKPKLVIFIDEAHQIFQNANPKLVDLMVQILKQIRSKGVGIIFNTQDADSIPEAILEQLGLKIQFALRSFTLKQLQEIRGVVESFPKSDFYNLKEDVKSLETGTAFVSTLNASGALLPPVKTLIFPPVSFMDALPLTEIANYGQGELKDFYKQTVTQTSVQGGESVFSEMVTMGKVGSQESPLDRITVSRGGKWQMQGYLQRKEEQKVNRIVNNHNKSLRKTLLIILAILGSICFIVLMIIVLTLIVKL